MKAVPLFLVLGAALLPGAVPAARQAPDDHRLLLHLLRHQIGEERYSVAPGDTRSTLTAHFEYHDRGATIALDGTLDFGPDYTPLSFEAHGKTYRYFGVNASVPRVEAAPPVFTLDGMAPVSAQGLLVHYWLAHGRPASITVLPSGDRVQVRERGTDRLGSPDHRMLQRYSIAGVIWGTETLWLDDRGDVAALMTTAGAMPFEAVAEPLEPNLDAFIRAGIADRLADAAAEANLLRPLQGARFALVGGRLIDGTGAPAIEPAVVIVDQGRIEAAGPERRVHVPAGVPTIDVSGHSILPGLWDTHAHVGQFDWGPVYLAAGVTTVRDMGGEFDHVVAERDAWGAGRALGPRALLAGLVDGPGPKAFGSVTAAGAEEASAVVRRYKEAGFQQIKLYNQLDRETVKALIEAAHASGMTVTGHIPNVLTLREAVQLGMDQVAHLVVHGVPGSPEVRDTIAFLKAHHTVMDPTISWNELLGRSADTTVASFQPGIAHVAAPLRRLIESANGGAITPEQAHDRLARSLAIVKEIHDAGIPFVAGTDKGVPGVSVAREIELYVQAGLTPIEAIRAATAVPARVMGLADDTGTLARGKRADLIVVDGNPLERISDIRNVALVCTDGRLYETSRLWSAGGFH